MRVVLEVGSGEVRLSRAHRTVGTPGIKSKWTERVLVYRLDRPSEAGRHNGRRRAGDGRVVE